MSFSESKELLDTLLCKFSCQETCSLAVIQQITKILTDESISKPLPSKSRRRLVSSAKSKCDVLEIKKEINIPAVKNDTVDKAQFAIKVFNESLKLLSEIVKLSGDHQNSSRVLESKKQTHYNIATNCVGLKKNIVNCSLLSFNIINENSNKLNIKQLGVYKAHANMINRLIDLEMVYEL